MGGGANINFNTTKGRQGVTAKLGTTQVSCYYSYGNIQRYCLTDDLLSGEDTTEWSEVEVTKEEYPSTTRNQNIVEDLEADITNVSSKIDLAAMSYKARAGKRGYTKSLIDSGCNRHMFGNRELFQDFVETLIPIKTAGNTIYAMGVGTVGKLRGCRL